MLNFLCQSRVQFNPFVSRHHCVIRNEGDECLIEDLNSANGTFLNGERVNKGLLNEGCIIQIGTSQFVFKLKNPEETIILGKKLIVANNGRSLDEFRSP